MSVKHDLKHDGTAAEYEYIASTKQKYPTKMSVNHSLLSLMFSLPSLSAILPQWILGLGGLSIRRMMRQMGSLVSLRQWLYHSRNWAISLLHNGIWCSSCCQRRRQHRNWRCCHVCRRHLGQCSKCIRKIRWCYWGIRRRTHLVVATSHICPTQWRRWFLKELAQCHLKLPATFRQELPGLLRVTAGNEDKLAEHDLLT